MVSKRKGAAEILLSIKEKGADKLKIINKSFDTMVDRVAKGSLALAGFSVAIGKLSLDASVVGDLRKAFSSLAESQGRDADEMLRKIKELTAGTISETDIIKQANNALLLGLPIDKFGEMVNIARGASRATGESMEFMLQSITTGLGRQSKLILDNLGIVFNLEEAYDSYAKTIGTTADKLSDAEKQQAFINTAIERGTENLERMGGIQPTVTDKWAKLRAQFKDNSVELGSNLIPLFEIFIDTIQDTGDAFASILGSDSASEFFESISIGAVTTKAIVIDFIDDLIKIPLFLKSVVDETAALFSGGIAEARRVREKFNETLKAVDEQKTEEREASLAKIRERFRKKEIARHGKSEKQKNDQEIKLAKIREKLKREEQEKAEEEQVEKRQEQNKQETEEFRDMWQGKSVAAERAQEMIATKQTEINMRMEAESRARLLQISADTQTLIEGGLQGLASSVISRFADTIVPGMGGAVGSLFNLLSQETDQFNDKLNQMLSTEFIDNIPKNLVALVEGVVEKLPGILEKIADLFSDPEFIKKMIIAIVGAIPEISSAFVKGFVLALGNPETMRAMAEAIVNGFIEGIRQAAGDIKKEIEDIFSFDVNVGGGGGGGFIDKVTSIFRYHGGPIPGYATGGPIDGKIIRATPGEFMVNAASAQANMGLLNQINNSRGRQVGGMGGVTINVNGGLLGDKDSAREFALAVDRELVRLRLGNESQAFDQGII